MRRILKGRLSKGPAKEVVKYLILPGVKEATNYLFEAISQINKAHVVMLAEQKIITRQEAGEILKVLCSLDEKSVDQIQLTKEDDLYMNIENFVIKRTTRETGGKIHIGRSRNDLYATAFRMVIRDKIDDVIKELIKLKKEELKLAENNLETVMPGYTHLEHAQPITLAHYLVGHSTAITRDVTRLENAYEFTNINPLGAGALATTSFPISRERTTELLGFKEPMANSLDAVASRDYILDFISALAITMSDVSRLIEDLILWNTLEFGMVEIADEYAGTSSIMPQKKNPFSLEHCRAKTGHVYGSLVAALTIIKGIPFMHCRDTSGEVPSALWPAIDQVVMTLRIVTGVLSTLKINKEIMQKRAGEGFSTTTDLADLIVRQKSLSFRTAHEIVASVVASAIREKKDASYITSEMIDNSAKSIANISLNMDEKDVYSTMDPLENVKRRNIKGGPAPVQVKKALQEAKERITREESDLTRRESLRMEAKKKLNEAMRAYI